MNKERLFSIIVYLVLIPALTIIGAIFLSSRNFSIVLMFVAILSCLPIFFSFEGKKYDGKELTIIAAMIAINIIGRLAFSFIPSFKAVTAFVLIIAAVCGGRVGFVVGSLSALISNFHFGQGPWTAFQMFSWGLIGLISGFVFKKSKDDPSIFVLLILGAFSGILFSAILDVWTVLSMGEVFSFKRYLAVSLTSLPFTLTYMISNIVFIVILKTPIIGILKRLKNKYGVFETGS